MKVTQILIENVLGIEHLILTPGVVTLIQGRNGTGKTSILESVLSLLRGGQDSTLLRHGAEKGQVRAVLDDGSTLVRTITAKGSTLRVELPGIGKASKAQGFVDALVGSELAVDPMRLLTCGMKDRAEYLAQVVAVDVTDNELTLAAGRPEAGRAQGRGLDRIDVLHDALYDERTGLNRTARDKRTTANQLLATLPAASDAPPNPVALRERKGVLERNRGALEAEAKKDKSTTMEAIQASLDADLEGMRQTEEQRLAELRRESQAMREARKAQAEADKERARTQLAERLAELEGEYAPELERLAGDIAKVEQEAEEYARAQRTREILAGSQKEAQAAEKQAADLTKALERLEALRLAKLQTLPVKGLEIKGGVVHVDGVPWERVNRARQIQVSCEVAALRAGKLGLVVVDNMEALDSKSWAEWEAAARAAGLQVVAARVTEDESLTVVTSGELFAA